METYWALQEELGVQTADTVVGADSTARVLVTNLEP